MKPCALVLLSAVMLASSGCAGLSQTNWCCPGTAQEQRLRAEQFDPYPQVTSGSEMAGVRPPGFDKPKLDSNRDDWPWNPGTVACPTFP